MENASYARVRLESDPINTKRGVGILSLVYVVSLVVFLVVGTHLGPKVFERYPSDEPEMIPTDSLDMTWYGEIDGMERWHQVLFLHMKLEKPSTISGPVSYEQRYTVSSWASAEPLGPPSPDDLACTEEQQCTSDCDGGGECVSLTESQVTDRVIKCGADSEWCGWTTLLTEDFVQYGVYYMEVTMEEPAVFDADDYFTLGFEMVYMSKSFTKFQMKMHYTWVLLALMFMFLPKVGFFYEMMQLHKNFWSRQQVRIGVLLGSLLFFNNIFFAGQIFSSFPRTFFSFYMVMLVTFLAAIMFFWLELFSDLASGNMQGTDAAQEWERNRSKALREYLPKLILVGLIWITTLLVYIYVRVKQAGDPSYSTVDDLRSYTSIKVGGLILYMVYFVWLGILVEQTIRRVRQMNIEYIFVTVITLVTIFGAMSAIFTGAFAPDQHGSKVLVFFYGMFNIYVLFLAFLYTPVGMAYRDLNSPSNVEMAGSAADDKSFASVASTGQHTIL